MGIIKSSGKADSSVRTVVSDAAKLRTDYRRMLQAQRTELRRILQRAYAAATPLLKSKVTWRAFVADPVWKRLGVERPEHSQQENAQLHFLRLVLHATPQKKNARDKAGKYARALDVLRSEDCAAGDVAAEIKARTIEGLARSKSQNGGAIIRAKDERNTEARRSPPVDLEDRMTSSPSMLQERGTPDHATEKRSAEARGVPPLEIENPVIGGLFMSAKTERALRQMDGRRAAIIAHIEVMNDVIIITTFSVKAAP
ncbi:hypothetical protein [Ancylobacter vacuolatus]|uniref:Uncharacterized protein n=1 Tax=Ancylobacter vacuolatus TaxID=223389 RepID=A0ABU0DLU9_9HYPH|nr:hypothetical protein [Ancylobacter vacuolatus]MDQ0349407.1 hypothetical protein [Ancylobacter vacuolatus]